MLQVGSHQLNMESSRSHAIFTVYCDATPTGKAAAAVVAQSVVCTNCRCAGCSFHRVQVQGTVASVNAHWAMEGTSVHEALPFVCAARLLLVSCADPTSYDYGTIRYGKLSFVDLAGSERVKDSKSEGSMLKETIQINKSLSVLGKVCVCVCACCRGGETWTHAHVLPSPSTPHCCQCSQPCSSWAPGAVCKVLVPLPTAHDSQALIEPRPAAHIPAPPL